MSASHHVKINVAIARQTPKADYYGTRQEPIELWLAPGVTYSSIAERSLSQRDAEDLAEQLIEASRLVEQVRKSTNPNPDDEENPF